MTASHRPEAARLALGSDRNGGDIVEKVRRTINGERFIRAHYPVQQ